VWGWAGTGSLEGAVTGAKWGVGGAAAGALVGAGLQGGAAYISSVNCGDGRRSPATMAREWLYNQLPSAENVWPVLRDCLRTVSRFGRK
jgi:hypothetical protein